MSVANAKLRFINDETRATYDAGDPAPASARRTDPFSMISKEASARVRALGPYYYAVYCYLSECANQDGECWPAYLTIAHELRMSRRQVIRMITGLKDAGLLVIEPRKKTTGDADSNLFRLPHFPRSEVVTDIHHPWCTPVTSAPQSPKQELILDIPPDTESESSLPEPTVEPVKPVKQAQRKKGTSEPPAFTEFWSVYPKKVDKKQALVQWKKLNPDPELITEIMQAVEAQKQGRKWQENFIKAPHRWLRDGNWTDEVEPPRAKPATGYQTKEDKRQNALAYFMKRAQEAP